MKMTQILIILSCLQVSDSQYSTTLSSYYQYKIFDFNRDIRDQNEAICFSYGIFTKYLPLSNFSQVGQVGIFDSNCFHIHSAVGQTTGQINFLYYDCLDFEKFTIEKWISFIGSDGVIYQTSLPLDIFTYESFWYFFSLMIIPNENTIILSIQKGENLLYNKEIKIEYPYYDMNLDLVFGGGLQLNSNQVLQTQYISKLSFFPGQISLVMPSFSYTMDFCQISILQNFGKNYKNECKCIKNKISKIPDSVISKFDQHYFTSEYLNCNFFNLQSWIRIQERKQYIKYLYLQLIKVYPNFQQKQLKDENLSPFQLYYKLTENTNQIIIKTYSYTLPSVNIDFEEDPFLITHTFDIDLNIQLWHYLIVTKNKNSMKVNIFFYDGLTIQDYSFESQVNQFNQIQFQIQYGNLLQTSNDARIEIVNMRFFNCYESTLENIQCHTSCLKCDGPTKFDCLSCDNSLNRIYIIERKSCVCLIGTTEQDGVCKNYINFDLKIVEEIKQVDKCSYGYFEFEDECLKCPSLIRENQITCIECLLNPETWISNPFCEYDFVKDKLRGPFEKITNGRIDFIFDGNELKVCEDCENSQDIFQDYVETNHSFKKLCNMCKQDLIQEDCYPNIMQNCNKCEIQISKFMCLKCQLSMILENEVCKYKSIGKNSKICQTPYYETMDKNCNLCPIENCLYCFEYLQDDYKQNTLFNQDQFSKIDKQVLVGCAQCLDGFIYDFTIGLCIYKEPIIQNCLRSFINQQGTELCTLSTEDDFTMAPELYDCQKLILNCRQCLQTLDSILKCIICEEGYATSISSGLCINFQAKNNEKHIVLWHDFNFWKISVQSFSILFMNTNPINLSNLSQFYTYPIECLSGYSIIQKECIKYCNNICQDCLKLEMLGEFKCTQCSENDYLQPYQVLENGQCLVCPSLCLICQTRYNNNLLNVNPFFIIDNTNILYTKQCIQSISNSNIKIDPYIQIAHATYGDDSQNAFEFYVININRLQIVWVFDIHFNLFLKDEDGFFENKFDFLYFNEIGLQQFILIIEFTWPEEFGYAEFESYLITNSFKEKVFSIQLVILKVTGELIPFNNNLYQIQNFDQAEIYNLLVLMEDCFFFEFQNRGKPIDYKILNTTFFSKQIRPIDINIQMDNLKSLIMHNVTILDATISNSIIFGINSSSQNGNILIEQLYFRNCIFNNTVLFKLKTEQKRIIIQDFFIEYCQFYNSSLFVFQQVGEFQTSIIIKSIVMKKSLLFNSQFIFFKSV